MSCIRRSSFLSLGITAFLLLAVAACSNSSDAASDGVVGPVAYVNLVSEPPPPPPNEMEKGISDPRTQIWRPGHWVFQNQQYSWEPGEMLTKPSPTAVWSPDHWERREYGWTFVCGYWQ